MKNMKRHQLQTPTEVEHEVYTSAGPMSKVVSKKDWYTSCLKFVDRNYDKSCKQTIQLPVDCLQDTLTSKFVNVLKAWCCSYQNEEKVRGMVLSSYDSRKHAEFLDYNMDVISKELKLLPDNDFDNRLLVYHPTLHVILNVRYLTLSNCVQLQHAMCVSCDDIKLEMLIHKDILFQSDVIFISLLVVPKLDQLADGATFNTGSSYDMLLLSYEDLSNLDSFIKKWERGIHNHLKKMRKDLQLNTKEGNKKQDIFLKMSSTVIGYMATAEAFLPSLRKMKLPVMCDNVHMQVKTVLLTTKQQEVLCSNERKIILTGSFGSGKSILGQLTMKQLYEKAEEDVKIYYVCCESQCLFQSTVQEIAKQTCLKIKKANAQIIARNLLQLKQDLGLDESVNLSRVIKLIYERNKNVLVHFVFDEYDAENLDNNEANEIKNVIKDQTYPKIDESVMVLITQSMEKHREYVKINQNGKERRQAHLKYQFDKTGLKRFDLPTTMRTTKRINDLIKVCIKHFEGNPSVFNHPELSSERLSVRKRPSKRVSEHNPVNDSTTPNKVSTNRYYKTNPPILVRLEAEEKPSVDETKIAKIPVTNARSTLPSPQVTDQEKKHDTKLHEIIGKERPITEMKRSLDNQATKFRPNKKIVQELVNLDVAFKLSNANQVHSEEKTRTEFKFNGTNHIGHNIFGEWPTLVSIHKNSDSSYSPRDIVAYCSLCLSKIAEKVIDDIEGLVVLSCDQESALMVKNAFSLINKESICYTPAFPSKGQAQSKEDILKCCRSENCILITDFVGFMGMEAEKLWVVVDKYDHFLKQHLVESLGRCTSELVIIKYDNPGKKEEKPNEVIKMILQDWEELVENITVEAIKRQGTQQLFVELSRDKGIVKYGLNVMSPQYKKEIDNLNNMKDESNHSTDHKAVMDTIKRNAHDPYFTSRIKDMFNLSDKTGYQSLSESCLEEYAFEDSGIVLSLESSEEINGPFNYRRMILEDRSCVKIKLENLRVLLKGNLENKTRMQKWLKLYFELKESGELANQETFESLFFGDYFETVMEDDEIAWSCISFVPTYAFGKIIGKRGENIRRISEQFRAGIVADKEVGKIFVLGSAMARKNVQSYFRFVKFKKEYVDSLFWSYQKLVFVGLQTHDSVELIQKMFCKDCERNCEMLSLIDLPESDLSMNNIPNLKELFSKVVSDIQILLRQNEANTCELMVHHGHIHIPNCKPGPKKVEDIISNGKIHFRNFSQSSYNFSELPYGNPHNDFVKYDISVFIPNQSFEMRYKVFLTPKNGNVSFITEEEAGILPAKFYPYRVGPGYLCIPRNVRRIDIIDPTTNTSTRLNFQIFQHNIVPESEMQKHIGKLKSFYESLSIKSNTLYLDIGTPPEGYLLTYVRRCERKTFKLSNITLLRTSEEEIEVRDGLNCEGEIENDIFLTSKLIQGNDIVLHSAEIGLQEILTHSKKLMHNLK
ncbi:uncharacterized protein LOC130636602 isoform X2 [Hydractinia symbiolongicarpus]|nr:uncharacterized protein LOC130636602 isoform X2 [Hydractinia symbiolongicarpus]XP_057302366.1 uncharacterized protein LOC130636602 isoform X2 [Hydractinia symbiolongicarpus]